MVEKTEQLVGSTRSSAPTSRVLKEPMAARHDAEMSALRTLVAQRESELSRLRQKALNQADELARLRTAYRAGVDRIASLEEAMAQRFEEIAALTTMLERTRAAAASSESVESEPHSQEVRTKRFGPAKVVATLRRGVVQGQRQVARGLAKLTSRTRAEDGERDVYREHKALLMASPLFDAEWYLAQYPDVASVGVDPISHYLKHGANEGRNPGPAFDTLAYRRAHPNIGAVNPLVDFIHRQQK